jgi:tripartite-type tricarboxylate transporter receptor subunit TctC
VLISHIGKGTLIPVGAAASQRSDVLAQVPTLAEQGYPDTDSTNWYGLLAPARTPPAVIARLNAAFNAALKDADVRKRLQELGATPVGGTPQEFGAYFKAEYEKWGKVVRERGIKG